MLLAFAAGNAEIGYCQSMSFVAATLLMYQEEEAKPRGNAGAGGAGKRSRAKGGVRAGRFFVVVGTERRAGKSRGKSLAPQRSKGTWGPKKA